MFYSQVTKITEFKNNNDNKYRKLEKSKCQKWIFLPPYFLLTWVLL